MRFGKRQAENKSAASEEIPRGSASLAEAVLGVHSALHSGWLADACATAAERGLGALYCLLYVTDSAGLLAGQRPTSSERVRVLGRLHDRLSTELTALRFRPHDREVLLAALRSGRAAAVARLDDALPIAMDEGEIEETQRRLGVGQIWVAPLTWNAENRGLLLLLMPTSPTATLEEAELLGYHAAIALTNLRERESGRKLGELDAVRWVYDEQRFLEQLRREIRRSERHGRPLSIMFLRVQNLRELRNQFGRFLMDGLLRELANRLSVIMRDTDFLGALQDDGFAAILVETNQEGARRAKQRFLSGLESLNLPGAELKDLQIELICATASAPEDGRTAEELAASAERRLTQQMAGQREVA